MNASEVETFLHLLGCSKVKRGHSWVNATCPFGYYHRKGKDSIPSFGVSIAPDGESRCRCQACGVHGPLLPLIWQLEAQGQNYQRAFDFLVAANQWRGVDDDDVVESSDLKGRTDRAERKLTSAQRWERKPAPEPERKPQASVPEAVLEQMREWMTDDVWTFLTKKRGLSEAAVNTWELGWMPKERRVCVPIRDGEGKLVSISGRLVVRDLGRWTDKLPEDSPPKYLHSPFTRNVVLYGMDKVMDSQRVGYLFEGFFQAIFSWQCGYNNVLGRMGTHLSGQQIDYLRKHFDKLVLVPDGDKAGYESVRKITMELQQELDPIPEVVVAPMPEGKDADQLSEDQLRAVLGPANR